MAPAVEVVIVQSDIIKEGTLAKQSKHLHHWRPRHFVLTPQYICSFKVKGDYRKPTEVIPLRDCVTVRSCEDEIGRDHAFKLEAGGRDFFLVADSAAEKEAWLGRIAKAMVRRTVMVRDQQYE
mmetsp:Transcript_66755/g.168503  ORF Transcript_66755/g.168503 Transcript_66755/m.168503 type:complete len:123 (+) Transcript_66755:103-471(+)|eukprot:CAMPEP_0115253056 /NCGR_PEP_ID=MMETSP0270-20121206/44472_1 /TAXON_ID=71861 /ORGANISM="Scrippsiella trochoidea, Strain CCMP3099" /LENGTH=122 /DNA_ID=CAMNT_0002668543 /DNA_START=100 /DNA_END=468 /DNA_ORIENTATION=+